MSLINDTMYFSDEDTETEENWYLSVNNYPVIINSTYIECYKTLIDIVNKYKYNEPERKFIIENEGEKFTLVSFPKNQPTSYERLELVADIIYEE